MSTTLGQQCVVFLDTAGVQKFKIISTLESYETADLPTDAIFVHKIVASNDPKADAFLRVANVVDLTTLPRDRETAVLASSVNYLANQFVVIYDDINTASQAKLLIQQRVDNLIADWHAYNEKFLAPLTTPPDTSVIPFPLTSSIVTERTDAYVSAHAAYLAAKTTSATASAALTASITAATAASKDLSGAIQDSQQCSTMLGEFNTGKKAIDKYRTTMNDFVTRAQTYATASSTFNAACATYKTYYDALKSASDTYITYTTPTAPQKTTFQTAIDNFNTARTAYEAALSAWNTARSVFEGFITSAVAAVSEEATQGQAVFVSLNTNMATACTQKIANVQIATLEKKDADTAVGAATTEKKAADDTTAAALAEDTRTYLSLKEVCPTYPRITP